MSKKLDSGIVHNSNISNAVDIHGQELFKLNNFKKGENNEENI